MTTFRRFSKRRRRAALVVALVDRIEWGEPLVVGSPIPARHDGVCARCGSIIGLGQSIVPALHGPPGAQASTYVHQWCPSWWDVLTSTVESYDDKIVTKINREGRGRASGCGHDVDGRPVYLVRRPVSLRDAHHSDWYCEACVTPGGGTS